MLGTLLRTGDWHGSCGWGVTVTSSLHMYCLVLCMSSVVPFSRKVL
jgi:hypothetical protein